MALSVTALAANDMKTEGGATLSQAEIDKWSITIYPDGRNLPDGKGTAIEGEKLYQAQCFMCHGESGGTWYCAALGGEARLSSV